MPHPFNSQSYNRYSYVYNNPIIYTDPSGHEICMEGTSSCFDPITKKLSGSLSGSGCTTCWSTEEDEEVIDEPTYGNGLIGPPAPPTYGNGLIGPPINQPHTGYSNPDLDALYFFWEHFVNPINGIIELDDIYRISSHGGWKAARYSLNLGVVEAIVQGGRQAYRDSWYKTLTPTQRLLRPLVVGGEALVTDFVAGRVGKGYRNAGFVTGGPLGAAGGHIAGQTFATKIMDRFWMEKVNPIIFSRLGVWP